MLRTTSLSFMSLVLMAILPLAVCGADAASGLKEGAPDLKSAGPLAFGPAGILFVADPLGAAVFAIDTGDGADKAAGPASSAKEIKVENINEKVAALLGTSPQDIAINDLAVNPLSGKAYLSISRGLGPNPIPVIVRVSSAGDIQALPLEKIKFAKASLPDAPSADPPKDQGKRRGNARLESITDLAFVDGSLLVAGLSNEEFASTLRSIPYPFKDVAKGTSVEIYHGAHGKLETHSPVRTFVPFKVGGESHLFAAYQCTPLVTFPLSKLKPGEHIKGRTVAELGNRNRPLDMVVYKKDGKDYLLIANSSRGVMKLSTENVEKAESITEEVKGGGTKGLPYDTIEELKGIDQLDRLDEKHALVVRRSDAGELHLETIAL
ncbi:MAG TPA: hypothetical protein VMT52_18270, partial [Planctomycetota bacterium]|nr:hypothetical protein [Planctomycetota bacterium]